MNSQRSTRESIADYKRRWQESPYTRGQGLEVEEVAIGKVIIRLPQARDDQRGGGGGFLPVLNGGIIAYMFDGALGWSITSALLALPGAEDIDLNELKQFTLNLDVTYLDAAAGERFEAHGNAVRVSRSTAFAEARFLDANGKVCATAKGIWRILWPRGGAPRQERQDFKT